MFYMKFTIFTLLFGFSFVNSMHLINPTTLFKQLSELKNLDFTLEPSISSLDTSKISSPINAEIIYSLSQSQLIWNVTGCTMAITTLYLADYSPFLKKILTEDYNSALKFFTKAGIYESKCESDHVYDITTRGHLIFIISVLVDGNSLKKVIEYDTEDIYLCEFDDGDKLEIVKSSIGIMLRGPKSIYELYEHGDLTNSYSSLGELGLYLCNSPMEMDKWYIQCKDPEIIVGEKIISWYVSNAHQGIVQSLAKSNIQALFYKCLFTFENSSGYLVFEKNLDSIEISGFATSSNYKINIGTTSYSLNSSQILNQIKLSGNIPHQGLLGKKIEIITDDEITTCVLGKFSAKKYVNTPKNFHGPIVVIILFLTLAAFGAGLCRKAYKR
ncbi:hypothetical protein SteCoe_22645 [Stentor coeruleus]|uniref:Uncharacterized protein n=1 Tax=Stentor coeruleus TaxID=5963 RepID=A0A1R2BLJ3_9CILI|nr:hypothetical protein SteCoe_22645 [Stentor coeruleus]